jgi:hypothetical protein
MPTDPFSGEEIQFNEYDNSIDPFAEDAANPDTSSVPNVQTAPPITNHDDISVLQLLQLVSEIPTLQQSIIAMKEEIATLTNTLNTLTNELETLKSTKQEEEVTTDSNVLEAGLSYIIQKAHSGDDPREIIKYIEEQAQKLLIQKNEGKL